MVGVVKLYGVIEYKNFKVVVIDVLVFIGFGIVVMEVVVCGVFSIVVIEYVIVVFSYGFLYEIFGISYFELGFLLL